MAEKHAFLKNTRIISIIFFFFISLTTTAAVAASVTLRWDPNDTAPEGYRVFARKSDQAYRFSQPDWEGSGVTCTINHLEDQTEYCFVVRAFDGNLESVNSAEVRYLNPDSTDQTPKAAPPSTETAAAGRSSDEDTTPPVWDGATDGAGLVTGNRTGGSVTVEFDTASDVIDEANLKYNVYYAESGSWDNVDWKGNDVVADTAIRSGSTFSYAVTISGLLNDVSYTFGVRAEDQSGNEDNNINTLIAIPAVSHVGNVDYELSLNQPAFASSVQGAGLEAFRVVDGSSATRWSSLFSNNQWIYVDLGTVQAIDRVVLDWETAYGARYEIQVSNNTANWTTVYTETNGDGDIDDIRFPSTAARYVRMRGIQRATPWGYSLFDFKVYAASESSPVVGSTPIALGRPAFASSTERSGLEATRAVDGSPTTRWSSTHSDHQWIYVDLGTVHTIDRVVLDWETAYGARYEIQVSDDAVVWNTVYTEFNGDGDLDDIPLPSTAARYVRMKGIQRATPWGYSLFELEVYGFNR